MITLCFLSCEKEQKDCKCGTIVNEGVYVINLKVTKIKTIGTFYVKNNCTGNVEKFNVANTNKNIGDDFCDNKKW